MKYPVATNREVKFSSGLLKCLFTHWKFSGRKAPLLRRDNMHKGKWAGLPLLKEKDSIHTCEACCTVFRMRLLWQHICHVYLQ